MLGINCKPSACRAPYSHLEVAPRALDLGRRAGGKVEWTQQGVGSSPTNVTHPHLLQKHPGGGDHSASLRPHILGLECAPLLSRQHQDGPSSISPHSFQSIPDWWHCCSCILALHIHPSQPQGHELSDAAPCWNSAGEVERSLPCGIHNPTPHGGWCSHGGCSPFQPTLVFPPASLPPSPSRNSITCVLARNLLCVLRKSSSRHTGDSGKQSAMDKAGSRGGWRSQAAGRKEGRNYTWRQQAVRTRRPLYPCPIFPHCFSLLAWFFEENLDQPQQGEDKETMN